MEKDLDSLSSLLLATLSFYHPFTLEEILWELDQARIENPALYHLNMEDLKGALQQLTKQKRLEMIDKNGEKAWKRVLIRKKSWWPF